jgi:hypothetical protein
LKEVKPLPSSSSSSSSSAATTTDITRVAKKQKGRLLFNLNSPSTDIDFSTIESDLIPLFLSSVSQQSQPENQNRVFALLDTGSLAGNFIASNVVEKLNLNDYMNRSSKKLCSVCSGLDNHCHDISDTIELTLLWCWPRWRLRTED